MNRSSRLFFVILASLLLLVAARWLGPASRSHASTLPSQDSFQGQSAAPLLLARVGSPSPAKAPSLPEPREILVKFKASIGPQAIDALNQAHGVMPLSVIPLIEVHTLQVPPGVTAVELALKYAAEPAVVWAEPNHFRRITLAPTDPLYSANQKWYYDLMRAEQGWGLETGRSSVVVAVVDSGVMCTHPDLAANMWKNPGEIPNNGIDDDNNGFVDDVFGWDFVGSDRGADGDLPGDKDPCVAKGDSSVGDGLDNDGDGVRDGGVSHGTEVAGIVGAAANNGQGVAGMAWGIRLMAVRVMNPEGIGWTSDIADGIVYAARNGAKIINLSLGSDTLSQTESLAIDVAHDTYGAAIIAASGNENHTPISYPARLPKVIAVGASDHTNPSGRAPFSNWGPELAVVAPGVDIASTSVISVAEAASTTLQVGEPVYRGGLAGTSESTPLVSGLAALLLSRNPTLTNEGIRNLLRSTARDLPDDPGDSPNAGPTWDGAGMVDAFAALSAVTAATPTPTPTGTLTPVATATPTATATMTPTPALAPLSFGPLTFGTALASQTGCQLSGAGASFSSGTLTVIARSDYTGSGGYTRQWFVNSVLALTQTDTLAGPSGCIWASIFKTNGAALDNGSYRLDLLVSGQVVQSGSFTVGPVTPTTTATPTPVSSATPTPVSTPISIPPTLSQPVDGQQLSGLGTTLTWTNPAGTIQVYFKWTPLNDDGPGGDLICNVTSSYTIMPPDMAAGANFEMLCGATYTWQARATSKTTSAPKDDPSWGPWSAVRSFKTRECSSATIGLVSPGVGATVTGMPTLQWSDTANDIFYYEIQLSKDPRFSEGGPTAPVLHLLIHGGTTTPKNSLGPANTNFQGWWNAFGGSGTYSWRVRPRKQATSLGPAEPGVSWPAARTFTVP